MYRIINQGKVVGVFNYFFDAWLCAVVEFPSCYSRIRGPDGVWIVNPKTN